MTLSSPVFREVKDKGLYHLVRRLLFARRFQPIQDEKRLQGPDEQKLANNMTDVRIVVTLRVVGLMRAVDGCQIDGCISIVRLALQPQHARRAVGR